MVMTMVVYETVSDYDEETLALITSEEHGVQFFYQIAMVYQVVRNMLS